MRGMLRDACVSQLAEGLCGLKRSGQVATSCGMCRFAKSALRADDFKTTLDVFPSFFDVAAEQKRTGFIPVYVPTTHCCCRSGARNTTMRTELFSPLRLCVVAAGREVAHIVRFYAIKALHEATKRRRVDTTIACCSSCILFTGHRLPTGDARWQSSPE
ncbi:unnamed protein product [Toxocara canis]|uniref:Saposin B-type domain-containing protein n=1 Tax=Toxocara canis TaxID=6265 RepID=A0A183UE94_TOXCA|nr:unnamed protein product [Toxocara canis]